MDLHLPKSVRRLLRRKCAAQQELAAYADRHLIGPRRQVIERHLAACDACLQQVAFLVRTTAQPAEAIPTALMHGALALAKQEVRQAYPAWKLALSGAFGILLLCLVSWRFVEHEHVASKIATEKTHPFQAVMVPENDATASVQDTDVLRGHDSESIFLFPSPRQRVHATNLVFRWKPVHQARLYEVELVTDDGSVLWTEKVKSLSATLPSNIHLVKDASYFIRLRVHTERGSVETMKAIEFFAK